MRNPVILLVVLGMISGFLTGARPPSTAKHFFWSMEGPKGDGYILGSIHLLKKEFYPLPRVIRAAFAASGALAVEADISAEKITAVALEQMQRGMYPEGDSLKNHISRDTWNLTARKLSELGMDIAGFTRFRPWMLALTIVSMEMMRLGFDPRWGVDRHLLDSAPPEMEILELEGLDAQMRLFEGFSDEMNDRFLFYNIKESENSREQVNKMVEAWRTGDTAAMESMLTHSIREHPMLKSLHEIVIHKRNRQMSERILEMLSPQRKLFVVVGAAHLVGESGIIARLRRKGYRLRQL